MKPFEGSWKCDTKFAAGAFGPGSPEVMAKSTVKFKKDMNGFFYRGDYEVKKQKGVDMPMKGTFYIGFDPGAQQIIVTGVDSTGGLGVGAGKITGDTATYTGESCMMGMKMKTRETMGMKGRQGRLPQARDRHGQGLRADGRGHLQEVNRPKQSQFFVTHRAVLVPAARLESLLQ